MKMLEKINELLGRVRGAAAESMTEALALESAIGELRDDVRQTRLAVLHTRQLLRDALGADEFSERAIDVVCESPAGAALVAATLPTPRSKPHKRPATK